MTCGFDTDSLRRWFQFPHRWERESMGSSNPKEAHESWDEKCVHNSPKQVVFLRERKRDALSTTSLCWPCASHHDGGDASSFLSLPFPLHVRRSLTPTPKTLPTSIYCPFLPSPNPLLSHGQPGRSSKSSVPPPPLRALGVAQRIQVMGFLQIDDLFIVDSLVWATH